MRYRSRRDLIHMAGDPAFRAVHPAKLLGTEATFSFPAQRILGFHAGPRTTVGLALALCPALGHTALSTRGQERERGGTEEIWHWHRPRALGRGGEYSKRVLTGGATVVRCGGCGYYR